MVRLIIFFFKHCFSYLCQAAVTIQDTCYEVQRLLLQASELSSPRAHCLHLHGLRANTLQEQEKQRNLEKRKEEVAAAQRLRERLRQEKERWERECQAKESQQVEQESRLEERERRCQVTAEKLKREREELEEQLEDYQQSLERLREGQRSVERERERLEDQQKLLQAWKHGRQSSLPTVIPHMLIPLDAPQVRPNTRAGRPADAKPSSSPLCRNSWPSEVCHEAWSVQYSFSELTNELLLLQRAISLHQFTHSSTAAQPSLDIQAVITRAISTSFVFMLQQLGSPVNISMINDY